MRKLRVLERAKRPLDRTSKILLLVSAFMVLTAAAGFFLVGPFDDVYRTALTAGIIVPPIFIWLRLEHHDKLKLLYQRTAQEPPDEATIGRPGE